MSCDNRIKNILIVGGGTAGWMTAAALTHVFGKSCHVQLVESDSIGTVGVGEATTPTLRIFNSLLGIDEFEFLKFTKGTYKLGINFKNWRSKDSDYFHPFEPYGLNYGPLEFHNFWLKYRRLNPESALQDYSISCLAAKHGRFSHEYKKIGSQYYRLSYAYHFDAGLYAKFLRQYSEAKGAARIEGLIEKVHTSDQGFIEKIQLNDGRELSADLYIDCSGFTSLLSGKALKTEYEDWSNYLLCDRAVAVQTTGVAAPVPYTTSTAHSSGWQWKIPLQHRVGNGHVYSSRHISDDEATATLLSGLDGNVVGEPRIIRFSAGMRKKSWVNNCISIGLSSGFLEPLESTSIYLIQMGIVHLIRHFPNKAFNSHTIEAYNRLMRSDYIYVRDFIIAHYKVTDRDDSAFWRYCRDMPIPETLRSRLEQFQQAGKLSVESHDVFKESNWFSVLVGQGLSPQDYHPYVDTLSDQELMNFVNQVRQTYENSLNTLPPHNVYIQNYCQAI